MDEARRLIDAARVEYSKIHSGSLVGLAASVYDNSRIESTPLLLDWDDIRIKLQKKNRRLINLKKRFVSSGVKA